MESLTIRDVAFRLPAPIIVVKGAGASAEHIRRVAAKHGVPTIEQRRLARAIYRRVDPNQPIPANEYVAVAEVLTQVQRQRRASH
jgi:flagellar biosynthesis protein FlhB